MSDRPIIVRTWSSDNQWIVTGDVTVDKIGAESICDQVIEYFDGQLLTDDTIEKIKYCLYKEFKKHGFKIDDLGISNNIVSLQTESLVGKDSEYLNKLLVCFLWWKDTDGADTSKFPVPTGNYYCFYPKEMIKE